MKVLIIGATGFLGTRLLKRLMADPATAGWRSKTLEIVATDVREPAPGWLGQDHAHLRVLTGNLRDPAFLDSLFETPFDVVFHLAAILTVASERDFERGLDMNVHGLLALLDRCRAQDSPPRFIFASSISTFGGTLPHVVDDTVAQTPQTSYGVHKVIGEQLINDYSRRGFVDGRVLRLATVLTHPGPPTLSVSDRIAALIREPLRGVDVECPFEPTTPIAVISARQVIDGFLRVCSLPSAAFGATRAMNLPALSTTPMALVQAVVRYPHGQQLGQVHWRPDPHMQQLIDSWPSHFTSRMAISNGITGDARLEDIISDHLESV